MNCSKCNKNLSINDFSYKKNNILYTHCNKCRDKIKNQQNKKQLEKDNYNIVKEQNFIKCKCGKSYVAFRDYHILRHNNTKYHLQYI